MNTKAALVEIEKFHRVFKAFEDAKHALESLNSIEQNVKYMEEQKIKLDAEILLLQATETQEKDKISTLKQEYKDKKEKYEEELQTHILTRLKNAEDGIVKRKEEVNSQILVLENTLSRMFAQQTQLQDAITEKSTTLERLENKLAAAQASINKLLG